MSYTITITVDEDPDTAEEKVRSALAEEGFGILTHIDVQSTLLEKLGEDVGPYRILGACNPSLAHRAIGVDGDIGALLPCNVVVRGRADGGTDVVAADPAAMLGVAGDGLEEVAEEARERVTRALEEVAS